MKPEPILVFFNGPPRTGKDTCERYLCNVFNDIDYMNAQQLKFSTPLKNAVHRFLGLVVDPEHFDKQKDQQLVEFFNRTPRSVYIDMAENWAKPSFGHDIWGQLFVRRVQSIRNSKQAIIVCSDFGFSEEIDPILKSFNNSRIAFCRVFRPGHDFTNDSRSYIDFNEAKFAEIGFRFDVHNNGTFEHLYKQLEMVVSFVRRNAVQQ